MKDIVKKDKEIINKFYHDLKTPLTVMKCNLELISMDMAKTKRSPNNKKLEKFIVLMNGQIDKVVKMVSRPPKYK